MAAEKTVSGIHPAIHFASIVARRAVQSTALQGLRQATEAIANERVSLTIALFFLKH